MMTKLRAMVCKRTKKSDLEVCTKVIRVYVSTCVGVLEMRAKIRIFITMKIWCKMNAMSLRKSKEARGTLGQGIYYIYY